MEKNKFEIFKPTKKRVLIFIFLGLLALFISTFQSRYIDNVGHNLLTKFIFDFGMILGIITAIVSFYILVCLILDYICKKK